MINPLPVVQSKKQFIDTLTLMITPPKLEEPEGEKRGHPNELKTYLIESNNKNLLPQFMLGEASAEIKNTGVDTIKILRVQEPERQSVEFYLDTTMERFLLLHTNCDSNDTQRAVDKLVTSNDYEFDKGWLSDKTLIDISTKPGNNNEGCRTGYRDIFQEVGDDEIVANNDLIIEGSGRPSTRLLQLAKSDPSLRFTLGYERIRISRGKHSYGIMDDLGFDGRFIVRKGRSVGDHLVLVDEVQDNYNKQVKNVEKLRMEGRIENGFSTIRGTPFEFEYTRRIDGLETYLKRIFNGREPFRIWGMKSKVRDGYYRILGVDMHTGHSLDIEASDHFFRVYLPKYSCGNVVLRLFVNLQRSFDSTIECPQISAM